MFSIGPVKIKYPIVLAPLSGITDLPFRSINRDFGCKFAFTEMINCQSLIYNNKTSMKMLEHPLTDRPLGVQLVGKDESFLKKSLDIIAPYKFDIIDLNAGCPQKKVTSTGRGAALLQEPKKLCKLLKIMVKKNIAPVTAKVRIGWDDSSDHIGIAKAVEDAGCDAVFIHGRTRNKFYGHGVDYQKILEMKKSISIPVIGSGDVFDKATGKKMLEKAGVDALLVARGALGNPWIFKELETIFSRESHFRKPSIVQIRKTMKKHLLWHCQYHGEKRGITSFRKFFHAYTYGLAGARKLRNSIYCIKTIPEMIQVIDDLV